MIYDCFPFHNEWDVLEIRLGTLSSRVDRFIIVEGDKTHSGKRRKMFLADNLSRYKKWLDKITLAQVKLPDPVNGNRFEVDVAQRNVIKPILQRMSPSAQDWVFISDCDEIPNLDSWDWKEGSFSCMNAAYRFNTVVSGTPWNGPCAIRAWRLWSPFSPCDPQDVRNFRDVFRTVGNGWHFGWTTNPDQKAKDFAHAELDDGRSFDTTKHPGDGTPLTTIPVDTRFPCYLLQHQERFGGLICSST